MRLLVPLLQGFAGTLLLLAGLLLGGEVVQNSRSVRLFDQILADLQAPAAPFASHAQYHRELAPQLERRLAVYLHEIQRHHLAAGMVVNRYLHDASIRDVCDSLLFSALRYVALRKLGYVERARMAWVAIEASQVAGKWFRHPNCHHRTSRDMITGLMAALVQEPARASQHLEAFAGRVQQGLGFFGDGPVTVSFLSPGLVEIVRLTAEAWRIPAPGYFQLGFSTLEFDALFAKRGYPSHLVGLQIWLELEVADLRARGSLSSQLRTSLRWVAPVVEPFAGPGLVAQRRAWFAQKLLERDPDNLFFHWLRLKTSRVATADNYLDLLADLLALPAFPTERLPRNCDRQADYLWQRGSHEYGPGEKCTIQYAGIDFLWLAGLIVSELRDLRVL